ncbi:hypothetical protein [Agarivorans sp. Toyoura001]|uniref:hypothetical protein n=1 Tax=Agarivorans sp. Toyoura001 TaxID=2283141 RepID=UPI0010F8FDC0|nr:hypothetical protein [Agarivorans sp. Toyoura001]
MISLNKLKSKTGLIFTSPKLDISLKYNLAKNEGPFFARFTLSFFKEVTRRHPRMPIFGRMTRGVAVCKLDADYDSYFSSLESSARRNVRKALRKGYSFESINYNDHLDDIYEIRCSTSIRQGVMDANYVNEKPKPNADPKPSNGSHNYPYFGVFDSNRKLVAYAGCIVAGELLELSHYFGHRDYQNDGIVPLLITEIAKRSIEGYSGVKYFVYGSYVNSSETLARFKKKLMFKPYHVHWILNE